MPDVFVLSFWWGLKAKDSFYGTLSRKKIEFKSVVVWWDLDLDVVSFEVGVEMSWKRQEVIMTKNFTFIFNIFIEVLICL